MLVPRGLRARRTGVLIALLFVGLLAAFTVWHRPFLLPEAKAEDAFVPRIVSAPNPNFRPEHARHIDTVVIHYSSVINVDPAHWDNPQLVMGLLKRLHVSAHYLVDRSGTIYRLVDEQNVAWHAGGSIMPPPDNRKNVNNFSIGIENIATANSGFTDAQYRALAYLIRGIEQRYPIRHILGHDQIAGSRAIQLGLRADPKEDPGPHFDWPRLRAMIR